MAPITRPMNALACFAALLAPLDPAAFFARYYEREPVHLRAPAGGRPRGGRSPPHARGAARMPWAGCPSRPKGWSRSRSTRACPDVRALLAGPSHLRAYLDEGHPLVWNRARGLWPAVDAVAAALAQAFGARVWPNVYATGVAGTPFGVHFDSHEVLAVQCEGYKEWMVSEVRVDRPLDAAEMEPAVAAAQRGRRDEAAAHPLLRFRVGPGSVVYVPRGQFHGATTPGAGDEAAGPSGRSLHVTFGIRQLTGFDVVKILAGEALADPLFRELSPAPGGRSRRRPGRGVARRDRHPPRGQARRRGPGSGRSPPPGGTSVLRAPAGGGGSATSHWGFEVLRRGPDTVFGRRPTDPPGRRCSCPPRSRCQR